MLVGNRVPYAARHQPTPEERQAWERHRAAFSATAASGLDVKESLTFVRHPGWQWNADLAAQNAQQVAHQGR
jgi:tryptophan halogenase